MCGGRTESGHALVEALLLGLVLMVPILWLLTVLGDVHAAALATTSAARESGFEAARAPAAGVADERISSVVAAAIVDHGLSPGAADVAWHSPSGWRRGDAVEIAVTYRVPVFQAPFLGAVTDPSIPITAHHSVVIDRYRSRDE